MRLKEDREVEKILADRQAKEEKKLLAKERRAAKEKQMWEAGKELREALRRRTEEAKKAVDNEFKAVVDESIKNNLEQTTKKARQFINMVWYSAVC